VSVPGACADMRHAEMKLQMEENWVMQVVNINSTREKYKMEGMIVRLGFVILLLCK
jgi:hypothetical protein